MRASGDVDLGDALAWVARVAGPVRAVRPLVGGLTSAMTAVTTRDRGHLVLRLMVHEPWRTHGRALTTRESEVQEGLAGSRVVAPRSVALDADGEHCGHPAHLMTLLPGSIDTGPPSRRRLQALAGTLATIHAVRPTIPVRDYESWAWEAKFVVPGWSTDDALWEDAFALLRTPPPAFEPTFLHRDFGPRNVLWRAGRISGVVDWVETSIGPAWLDVAHGATNLAVGHGGDAADTFARSYASHTGREPQPYFDVMDVVGFLPPPGRSPMFGEPGELARLEDRLRTVLPRVRG